jgi:hypothetical protein
MPTNAPMIAHRWREGAHSTSLPSLPPVKDDGQRPGVLDGRALHGAFDVALGKRHEVAMNCGQLDLVRFKGEAKYEIRSSTSMRTAMASGRWLVSDLIYTSTTS